MTKEKWGILGGTFDPIHYGHLRLAQEALDHFNLEKIIFVPAGNPYHKNLKTSAEHRYTMTFLATVDNPNFLIDDCDILRQKPTYSFDTLSDLKQKYPDIDFSLILGFDAFLNIEKWHQFGLIKEMCRIIVATRAGFLENKSQLPDIPHDYFAFTQLDISSTLIKNLIKANKNIKYLLPDNIIHYIKQHKIYDE